MALWTLDRRACVLNAAARQLLDISEDDIHRDCDAYLHRIDPEDRRDFLAAWKRLRDGEGNTSCCYRLRARSGQTQWLQEISVPIAVAGKTERGALTIYAEKQRQGDPSGKTSPLSILLPGLCHEIGNHLQAISGELELLRWSGMLPADSAGVISAAMRKILNLGHDLQEYFLPSLGRDEDPALVVTELLSQREEEFAANGIRTNLTIREAIPLIPLKGQFARVCKALIDFSCALIGTEGNLKLEAGLCQRGGREHVRVDILSESSHFQPVDEDCVFRPFTNVAGYRAGLSMALAQRIVLRYGGEIAFRKEQPTRGVFSIFLPIADNPEHAHALA